MSTKLRIKIVPSFPVTFQGESKKNDKRVTVVSYDFSETGDEWSGLASAQYRRELMTNKVISHAFFG